MFLLCILQYECLSPFGLPWQKRLLSGWLINNKNLFFTVLGGLEVQNQGPCRFFFFFKFRAAGAAYGSSQARGSNQNCSCWPVPQPQQQGIWAAFATYTTAQGNTGSLTHWARPGIEHASSWVLVGFVSAKSQQKVPGLCRFDLW